MVNSITFTPYWLRKILGVQRACAKERESFILALNAETADEVVLSISKWEQTENRISPRK